MVLVLGLCAGLALALSFVLIRFFLDPHSHFHIKDQPNARSLHSVAVPRTGGVAIVVGYALALAAGWYWLDPPSGVAWVAAAFGGLALLGFLDDRHQVSSLARFLAHALAALMLVGAARWGHSLLPYGGGSGYLQALLLVLIAIGVMWMINLYNFMDGMDGLAGAMGLIGFGGYAGFGVVAEAVTFAVMSATLAAACLGFLVFNYPPARIFMGDAGSTTLGFLAAAFGLWGIDAGILPLWAPLLVFSPFVVDASWTLLRRALKGEKIWQAHRSHAYQRLVLAGWGHKKTLWAYLGLMVAAMVSSWVARNWAPGGVAVLFAVWALVYAGWLGFVAAVERSQHRRKIVSFCE